MLSEREYAEEMCNLTHHEWQSMGEGWYQCDVCGAWDFDEYEYYEEDYEPDYDAIRDGTLIPPTDNSDRRMFDA